MKYLAILVLISFISCKGTQDSSANLIAESSKTSQKTSKQVKTYQELAVEKIGEGVKFFKNKSETLVLCKKMTISKNIPMGNAGNFGGGGAAIVPAGAGNVQCIVVKIESGEILFEQSIAYGGIDWATDTQLRIFSVMGANMPNNPNMYLYDVLTKEKTAVTQESLKKLEKN